MWFFHSITIVCSIEWVIHALQIICCLLVKIFFGFTISIVHFFVPPFKFNAVQCKAPGFEFGECVNCCFCHCTTQCKIVHNLGSLFSSLGILRQCFFSFLWFVIMSEFQCETKKLNGRWYTDNIEEWWKTNRGDTVRWWNREMNGHRHRHNIYNVNETKLNGQDRWMWIMATNEQSRRRKTHTEQNKAAKPNAVISKGMAMAEDKWNGKRINGIYLQCWWWSDNGFFLSHTQRECCVDIRKI